MSGHDIRSAERPEPDQVLVDIADYVCDAQIDSELALETAHYCLMDTLACGFQALDYPACTKLLGPVVPGATLPGGSRVPGTSYELDPVLGAFNIGALIRWLDFNDTWLAAEWGHPSDNLGGILATADYLSRLARAEGKEPLKMRDVLLAMIKAHEIQGVLALENSYNRVGLDHVLLVRVATAAVVTRMLGGDRETVINAVSHAWIDGCSLRTYRHAPNTGSRKSWAAGDATSRGVRLALIAMTGEMGYPSALSAKTWGYYDVLFKGNEFAVTQGYDSYVMENTEEMTHREFINSFMAFRTDIPVEEKLSLYLGFEKDSMMMERLKWLGIFDDVKIGVSGLSPAKILQKILEEKWDLNPGDKDMIVMQHQFDFTREGIRRKRYSTMVYIGKDTNHTAMSDTVGLPLAMVARRILEGDYKETGVQLPIQPEIYNPVMIELEEHGIRFVEEEIRISQTNPTQTGQSHT
jgi:hypothetical protein